MGLNNSLAWGIYSPTAPSIQSGASFNITQVYQGVYGGVALFGDFGQGYYVPNTAAMCQAYFQFTSFTSTYTVYPKIAYFPSSSVAYPGLYNTSTGIAYVLNNSIEYIIGTDNNTYVLPPITCASYSSTQTADVLLLNGTTFSLNSNSSGGSTAYSPLIEIDSYPLIPLSGITVFAYTSNGTLISGCLTGSSGQCAPTIASPNNGTYLFNFTYGGTQYSFGPQAFQCSGAQCTAQLVIGNPSIPSWLQNTVTGSCSYSNPTLSCSASDSSSTITSYTLELGLPGQSFVCWQNATGSSASLSCSVPQDNQNLHLQLHRIRGKREYDIPFPK